MNRRRHPWTLLLPLAGVALFLGAYIFAAAVYPGGTSLDAHTVGYTHLADYWCDLLAPVACNGHRNPGRPIALVATVVLPISLAPLWFALPTLFGPDGRRTPPAVVRGAGGIALLAAALVFTPLHDAAITAGAAAGLLAGIAAVLGLLRGRRWMLVGGGVLVGGVAAMNYALWATRTLPDLIPIVQKGAYIGMLAWALLAAYALADPPIQWRARTDSDASRLTRR